MTKQLENVPEDWRVLDKDARDSTVAWFLGGYSHTTGMSVLVWKGVETEDGSIVIETSNDHYNPARHTCIIEVMYDGSAFRELFADDENGAWQVANALVTGFDEGELIQDDG